MRFVFRFCAGLFLNLVLFSCSYGIFTDEDICVSLPDWNQMEENFAVPELAFWKLAVVSENGIETKIVREKEVIVSVKKNRPFCVLVWPMCMLTEGMYIDFFKPAGGLYSGMNGNCLELTWQSGYPAYLMMSLFENADFSEKAGTCISRFNWSRFENALELSSFDFGEGDYCYNPWNLDLESIMSSIAHNTFRVSLLNQNKIIYAENSEWTDYISSYMPENEILQKNGRICLKQSEVNLISDYNLNGIIITGKSEKNLSVKYTSLPIFKTEYE